MTLYIECNMGAAGDMLMASLLELQDKPEEFINVMNNIGLDDVKIASNASEKCGINGTSVSVFIHGNEEGHENSHSHSCLKDIHGIIDSLNTSDFVKKNAKEVYDLIADAESKAHGVPCELVHFHEVGAIDAIADIVGVCILMESLSPSKIVVSPINVGKGQVKTSHGILPVPAPATASILNGTPIYSNDITGELCTPTGAALLVHFADEFGNMPICKIKKIGYGMGKKDFEAANCVRSFLCENVNSAMPNQEIDELICNLDDMTAEAISFATNILFENGALDVFTTPIYMKKNRLAVMLTCLCNKGDSDKMAALILKNTSTIGVRKKQCQRYALGTVIRTINTKYGDVRFKISKGYNVTKAKPEFDDIAKLSKQNNIHFSEVYYEALSNIPKE